jgi:hypothetical protein
MKTIWTRVSEIAVGMALLLGLAAHSAGEPPKLKPEEVVAHYLDSIGTPAARAAAKSRVVRGTCRMAIVQGGNGEVRGPAVFESDGRRLVFQVDFNHVDYPRELVGFDGERPITPYVQPGKRSHLGDLAFQFGIVVREGLLGAAFSTASPLFDLSGRKALLDYEGLKKINGRELHQLLYRARKDDPNMIIRLYFEPETFRHVMTIYNVTASGTLGGNPDDPAQASSNRVQAPGANRLRLEETFADFKTTPDGLTLPMTWKLRFSSEPAAGAARAFEWTMAIASISHSNALDPALFNPH